MPPTARRYMVPEQRVLRFARIGPEQVAGVAATEQEIAAYYNANQATYGAKEIRVISQAVVPDRSAANAHRRAGPRRRQLRRRGRSGRAQRRGRFGRPADPRANSPALAGDAVAAAAFAAPSGAIVGPVQSDLGWHVVKIDSIRREGGKPLAEARGEIAAKLTADKRKEALTDLVTRVEDAIAEGSNFAEAAGAAKLPVTETPLITAGGTARDNPAFRLPGRARAGAEERVRARRGRRAGGRDACPTTQGYVLVAPSRIVPATPAPLATIRDRVARGLDQPAGDRSARQAVANAIAAKAARGVPLAKAVAEAGVALPPVQPVGARRLAARPNWAPNVPAPLRMLFTLGAGKSRMVADPQQRGFFDRQGQPDHPRQRADAAGADRPRPERVPGGGGRGICARSSSPRCAQPSASSATRRAIAATQEARSAAAEG